MIDMSSLQRLIWSLTCQRTLINQNHININFMGMQTKQKGGVMRENANISAFIINRVLVHKGNLTGGHYFAFVRPGKDDKW